MSIFVSIEDKEGEQLAKVFELQGLQRHFPQMETTLCLRFVTETEDAAFNQTQLPHLIAELEELEKKGLKREESGELAKLMDNCRKALGKKGVSVRFYADQGS